MTSQNTEGGVMGVTTDYERVPRFMSDDADLWAGSRLLWARTTIYKRIADL